MSIYRLSCVLYDPPIVFSLSPCPRWGEYSPGCHRVGAVSILGQSRWDLWWPKWQMICESDTVTGFSPSISVDPVSTVGQCYVLIHSLFWHRRFVVLEFKSAVKWDTVHVSRILLHPESLLRGGAGKSLARPGRKQATATKRGIYSTFSPRSSIHFLASCFNFCKPLKKSFRRFSFQPGPRGSNDLRVGRKMATIQLFFQSR